MRPLAAATASYNGIVRLCGGNFFQNGRTQWNHSTQDFELTTISMTDGDKLFERIEQAVEKEK